MEKATAGRSYHLKDRVNKGNRMELLKLRTLNRGACRAGTRPSAWGPFSAGTGALLLRGGAVHHCAHRSLRREPLLAGANIFDDGIMHLFLH